MNYDEVTRKVMYEELYKVKLVADSMKRLSKLDNAVVHTYLPTIISLLEDCDELETNYNSASDINKNARETINQLRDVISELKDEVAEYKAIVIKQREYITSKVLF